ncbi:MAG TPA: SRPBCC domain-containing protein [Solirubrobacteraceae bacterium]|jgi:uncharacterized protein YndB with AHSA1/START domain
MAGELRRETTVALAPSRAFSLFAEETGSWWPKAYTWSAELLVDIVIGAREGEPCYELGPHGFRCDWGRVLDVYPPRWLEFTWQIGPDRLPVPDATRATEVAVEFLPAGDDTARVCVHHRGFDRHGAAGAAYCEGMGPGWEHLLACFAAAAADYG